MGRMSRVGSVLLEVVLALFVVGVVMGAVAGTMGDDGKSLDLQEEKEIVATIGATMKRSVLANRSIYLSAIGATTGSVWSTGLPIPSGIAGGVSGLVYNAKGCARRWWVDPTSGYQGWNQDIHTIPTAIPTRARGMLISDMSEGCVNNISTPTTTVQFDGIWNQTGTPALIEGADLVVERVSFLDLFVKVGIRAGLNYVEGTNNLAGTQVTSGYWYIFSFPAGTYSHSTAAYHSNDGSMRMDGNCVGHATGWPSGPNGGYISIRYGNQANSAAYIVNNTSNSNASPLSQFPSNFSYSWQPMTGFSIYWLSYLYLANNGWTCTTYTAVRPYAGVLYGAVYAYYRFGNAAVMADYMQQGGTNYYVVRGTPLELRNYLNTGVLRREIITEDASYQYLHGNGAWISDYSGV